MKIRRGRYLRIIWYFSRLLLSLLWWEFILARFVSRGLAQRGASERRRRWAASFRALAVEMGGVLIKLGQFLSSRADVMPPEITKELAALQDEVPPDPFPPVKQLIEEELGAPIPRLFSRFVEEPQAGASLGQTYYAWLPDGDPVIVKAQRPHIEELVATDLAAVGWAIGLIKWYPALRRRVDLGALFEEFTRITYAELDYIAEGRNAEELRANFADNPDVFVPRTYWSHTSKRVLTLQRADAIKVTDYEALTAAGIDRTDVAERVFGTYVQQMLIDGFFHADPHPGNLFVEPRGPEPEDDPLSGDFVVTFVDFGMMGRIDPREKALFRDLAIHAFNRDVPAAITDMKKLGFILPGTDTRPLERALYILIDRYYGLSVREFAEIEIDEMLAMAYELRDIIYEFPFQIPIDFVLLARALGILEGLCVGLDPDFNGFTVAEPYVRQLMAMELAEEGVSERAMKELQGLATLLWRLPRELDDFLSQATRGELEVGVVVTRELERLVGRLERAIDRLITVIAFASFLMAGVVLLRQDLRILGASLLIISFLTAMYLIFRR
ncbi:MAG: AarF/ABC1/UbiB kinase family protein [Anaerolineae bacterium]|nr:AarF/ABC1/UbiB kinase family protein [Anaerolineae bacterium]NIN94318.1 AarF/ABC1/UbiB kinase family protein [Anaerolineae bacterium]NIQ77381.1 AarF/ABC1/UbiB kinase family protein [Anaerolineae bacterium]